MIPPSGSTREPTCEDVRDELVAILEGTAPPELYDHLASCDECRDLRHDAAEAEAAALAAGHDYRPPARFADDLFAAVDARARQSKPPPALAPLAEPASQPASQPTAVPAAVPTAVPVAELPAEPAPAITAAPVAELTAEPVSPKPPAPVSEPAPRSQVGTKSVFARKKVAIGAGFAFLAAAGGLLALSLRDSGRDGFATGARRWSGSLARVVRPASAAGEGVSICNATGQSCQSAAAGAALAVGSVIRTDASTRAFLKMSDGSELVLDRGSELALATDTGRAAAMKQGALVADIAHLEDVGNARFSLPGGTVEVLGTKLALYAQGTRSRVEVTRGVVRIRDEKGGKERVFAGEEGRLEPGSRVSVAPSVVVAEGAEWSEPASEGKEAEAVVRGLGELRAKKPGAKDERDAAVRLAKHFVKTRIVDNVARTEIDETFQNESDDELEGIFRFPLPPDAQIERLALEVGGKLEEGAFVERDKAAAIWRGVIQHAVPTAPKPVEEIIWVPGPWRDPALLEWKRGGRFELRIFPIPKKGSRRIVLAYTQTVAVTGGVRRYTYPLPHDARGSTAIDEARFDVQVIGHDPAFGVRSIGYPLTAGTTAAAMPGSAVTSERQELRQARFVPAGDLVVEYALPDREKEISTWAYQPTKGADDAPYAVLALRPKLPRSREEGVQTHVIVVDASRSMVGERFARATEVATRLAREIDGRDRVQVLACDASCRALDAHLGDGGATTAAAASRFLRGIVPDGAADAVAMLEAAQRAAAGTDGKSVHIVYVGDGGFSAGPAKAAHLTAEIARLFPKGRGTVSAVAIGADADTVALAAVARGGGGIVVPYVPGQSATTTALAALGSAYGASLRAPVITLPEGFVAVAPATLDTIRAGSETLILARMTRPNVKGEATLRGTVGTADFSQTYPLDVVATSDQGNAFVPRLYAGARIADLERAGGDGSKGAIVELSRSFAVASRYTSLLVLESQAMFTAFGLDRSRLSPAWTGEENAQGSAVDGTQDVGAEAAPDAVGGDDKTEKRKASATAKAAEAPSESRPEPAKKRKMDTDSPFDGDEERKSPPRDRSAGEFAPPPPVSPGKGAPAATASPSSPRRGPMRIDGRDGARRSAPMVPMRRIWERKGQIVSDLSLWHSADASRLVAAESLALTKPDNRGAQRDLFAQHALHGRLERASEVAEKWASRDALDPDALVARADLAARSGDREGAIRILGGLADLRPDDPVSQNRLAGLFDRAQKPREACAHRIALAELRPTDSAAQGAAIPCARATGFGELAERLLGDVPADKRAGVEAALSRPAAPPTVTLRGDVQLEASWDGAVDLDVALVDKSGTRLSWLGAGKLAVTALGATETARESVGFVGLPVGDYLVEITRGRGGEGTPVTGALTVRAAGSARRTIPFVITGARAEVAHVKIAMQSRLVPADGSGDGRPWR